jgi:hypothetical protein
MEMGKMRRIVQNWRIDKWKREGANGCWGNVSHFFLLGIWPKVEL